MVVRKKNVLRDHLHASYQAVCLCFISYFYFLLSIVHLLLSAFVSCLFLLLVLLFTSASIFPVRLITLLNVKRNCQKFVLICILRCTQYMFTTFLDSKPRISRPLSFDKISWLFTGSEMVQDGSGRMVI